MAVCAMDGANFVPEGEHRSGVARRSVGSDGERE
jgi:hypothetical protein